MKVAIVVQAFPITHTFILNEVVALLRQGVDVSILAIKRSRQPIVHQDIHRYDLASRALQMNAFPASADTPVQWREHVASLAPPAGPRWRRILAGALGPPHPTLPLGAVAQHLVREGVDVIHGTFGNGPATAAMVLSELSGIPFTFETHAYDLFVNFPFAKEKIEKASVIQTESGYHREFLETCGAPREKVKIIHLSPNRQMLDELPPVRRRDDLVVSICRLHPIKGLVHALRAVARVTRVFPGLEYAIVGTGPLQQELLAESRRLGIERHVRFTGGMSNEDACALLREAAVFLLPSVVAPDGDRDGTPTAIAEAMQLEVPVISSRLSGIPELVEDGVTGLLTAPGDVDQLSAALTRLLGDAESRRAMGRAGRQKVLQEFNVDLSAGALLACWRQTTDAGRSAARTPVSAVTGL